MQHSDCQMETQCADQIKEESSCSDNEECSMSKAVMPASLYTNHKPLCSDSAGYGVSEAEKLTDEVKKEALCSDGMTGMSESAMLAGVDTDHDVKDELVSGSKHVKEEPSSESEEYRMSEAAMLADLYADHVVKEELVLGPEHPHRPEVSLVVLDWALAVTDGFLQEPRRHTSATHPALKDCCVRLERLHHEAPALHTIQDTTHTDSEPEDEMYTTVDCERVPEPVCDLCGKKFSLKSELLKHVMTHIHTSSVEQEGTGPVVADYVFEEKPLQERVLSRDSPLAHRDGCVLLEHLQHHEALDGNDTTHTDTESDTENIYARDCIINNRRTTTSDTDNDNDNIYARDCKRKFICDLCGKKFALKAGLIKHVVIHIHKRTHTGGTIYTCALCNMKFASVWRFNAHKRTHTNERPHACGICGKRYTRASHLTRHNRYHTGEKPFSCKMCDKKYSEQDSLNTHIRSHTGAKPYSCEICKKRFAHKGSLKTHILSHTGAEPYSCETCKKRFARKGSLKRHILSHTGAKLYSCEICKKRFAQKCNLNTHIPSHTGETPYSCETCKKRFAQKGSLNTHILCHTGAKPYSCEICKKRFAHKCNLNKHIPSHTGETPYSCETCKKRFAQKGICINALKLANNKIYHLFGALISEARTPVNRFDKR
ncbi:zinc finger protein 260-like [Cydia amplana]|uniref:zinc finger protein 260-like n=1 Tax=Cydia amplana TaxID=1869771 RepID=UPI002FE53E33